MGNKADITVAAKEKRKKEKENMFDQLLTSVTILDRKTIETKLTPQ